MKPHYRDQLLLGLIIVVIIALWRLGVWLLGFIPLTIPWKITMLSY